MVPMNFWLNFHLKLIILFLLPFFILSFVNLGLRGGVDAIEAPRVETERGDVSLEDTINTSINQYIC